MTPEELYQEGLEAYDNSDYETAFSYFRQAAEQGHTNAEYEVGMCYLDGDGVNEDEYEAAKWFRKAALKGHAEAQFELAELLEYNYYGYSSSEETFGWYKKAADQGNIDSAFRVAKMYYGGIGTEQSNEKAMEYYLKVANSKEDPFDYPIEEAMRETAWLYYFGRGVKKNEYAALKWLKKSVELIKTYPNPKPWTEKVAALCEKTSDRNAWLNLKKYIDINGNIIEKK